MSACASLVADATTSSAATVLIQTSFFIYSPFARCFEIGQKTRLSLPAVICNCAVSRQIRSENLSISDGKRSDA
jgi:hypothetical protein